MRLRQPPSGNFIEGNADQDILVWNESTQQWDAQQITFVSAFDYILESRDDLVAVAGQPVSGQFSLPDGSYAIKTGFALADDEGLLVPAGGRILMMGMGPSKGISTRNTSIPALDIPSDDGTEVRLLQFGLEQLGTGPVLRVLGDDDKHVEIDGGRFIHTAAAGNAFQLGGGNVLIEGTRLESSSPSNAISQTAGELRIDNCDISSAGSALNCNGATGRNVFVSGSRLVNSTTVPTVANISSGTDLFIDDCYIENTADNGIALGCGVASACSSVQVTGGEIKASNTGGQAIQLNDVNGGFQLCNVTVQDGAVALDILSGASVNRCSVNQLDCVGSVGIGIDMAAADVPSDGITISGCTFGSVTTPFNGFTAATAKVNAKLNSNSSGLMTETAIVP